MASKGEVGIDIDVARVPLREAGMEPFEIMVSESQERMLCVGEPGRVDEVLARLREVGGPRRPRSARSPTRGTCGCSSGDELVGDMPVARARRRLPAVRPRARDARQRRSTRAPPRDARPERRAARGAARAAARRRTSPRAGRCSSSTTDRAVAHGAPAGAGRRGRAAAARRLARSASRSTATAAASRPTRTAARSRRCSSARRTSPASAPSRSA